MLTGAQPPGALVTLIGKRDPVSVVLVTAFQPLA